jgi:hypothetical protein
MTGLSSDHLAGKWTDMHEWVSHFASMVGPSAACKNAVADATILTSRLPLLQGCHSLHERNQSHFAYFATITVPECQVVFDGTPALTPAHNQFCCSRVWSTTTVQISETALPHLPRSSRRGLHCAHTALLVWHGAQPTIWHVTSNVGTCGHSTATSRPARLVGRWRVSELPAHQDTDQQGSKFRQVRGSIRQHSSTRSLHLHAVEAHPCNSACSLANFMTVTNVIANNSTSWASKLNGFLKQRTRQRVSSTLHKLRVSVYGRSAPCRSSSAR